MPTGNVAPAIISTEPSAKGADRGVAALGALTSVGAVLAALACCVLPLGLAALGVGAGLSSALKPLVPLHWPLSIVAMLAVASGWILYLRRRRMACAEGASCGVSPPSRATLILLCAATLLVVLSSLWPFIEPALMRLLEPA